MKRVSVRMLLCAALALALVGAVTASAPAFEAFVSPSHNIGCIMDKESVRCDIGDHSWQSPPKPKWCDVDYGGGVAVGRNGKASWVCAGDTVLNSGPVLPYGQSATKGRFRCSSGEAGMRCVNARNGHGFLLSKQKVRLF